MSRIRNLQLCKANGTFNDRIFPPPPWHRRIAISLHFHIAQLSLSHWILEILRMVWKLGKNNIVIFIRSLDASTYCEKVRWKEEYSWHVAMLLMPWSVTYLRCKEAFSFFALYFMCKFIVLSTILINLSLNNEMLSCFIV